MSEYIHAALLLHSAKQEITEGRIKAIMRAAGIEPDEARIKVLVSSLSKVNIDEVLSAPLAIGPVAPAAQAAQQAPAEKEKEEKPAEEMAGLGALFA
ncbi:MAG: 50S ribosomal protein P1 [Candidatus Brockarchaeota archaeon]|nr:50S ribosomal protein P1 [Candidatus Brockarchaeota archaeon]MBO3808555.1 50S ribosomal protein P1 [Candidatus Brockarchaeota archaeon]